MLYWGVGGLLVLGVEFGAPLSTFLKDEFVGEKRRRLENAARRVSSSKGQEDNGVKVLKLI